MNKVANLLERILFSLQNGGPMEPHEKAGRRDPRPRGGTAAHYHNFRMCKRRPNISEALPRGRLQRIESGSRAHLENLSPREADPACRTDRPRWLRLPGARASIHHRLLSG